MPGGLRRVLAVFAQHHADRLPELLRPGGDAEALHTALTALAAVLADLLARTRP